MIIHLVMMVRDCAYVIEKTLDYARPYVDKITIVDTGSIDRTLDILKNRQDIFLHQIPFIDFPTSRNQTLQIAEKDCYSDYIMMLDDSYLLYGGYKLRKILTLCLQRPDKAYGIMIKDDETTYYSVRIFKTQYHLRYVYPIHEIIETDSVGTIEDPEIYIYDQRDQISNERSTKRYQSDVITLGTYLQSHPEDLRTLFYLAITHSVIGNYSEAIKYFKQRIVGNKGFQEEIFISLYNLANLASIKKEKWCKIHKKYLKAYNFFPHRAEPLYRIGLYYFNQQQFPLSFLYLNSALNLPLPKDTLFVEHKVYTYLLPILLANVAINAKQISVGSEALKKALQFNPNDDKVLQLVSIYQQFQPSISSTIIKHKQPILVINMGYYFFPWSPKTELVRGSEIVPVLLGKELVKLGFQVNIFAQCKDDKVDYSGFYDGIDFRDLSYYQDFIKNNYIDYLIVSRYSQFLAYYSNINKVYLWLHDVVPADDLFTINDKKFKGVLCLSQWHKDLFSSQYNFPKDLVYITSNAIDPDRFKSQVQKQLYRFIYSSNPIRGLEHLIKIFPKIIQKYPTAQLHIYCSFDLKLYGECFWSQVQKVKKLVEDNSFVINHGCINQQELAQEFLKSHVWFYPNDFDETYCITALEAQMSRTLCITTNRASLTEVVGDRGILIDGHPSTEQYMNTALSKLFFVLDHREIEQSYLDKGYQWAKEKTFKNLAQEWKERFLC